MRIRKVKNSAGNISIQVGYYRGKHFMLIKHIGSARNNHQQAQLMQEAHNFINQFQLSLFDTSHDLEESDFVPIGYTRQSAYDYLSAAYDHVFPSANNQLLKDLAIMRMVCPTSKLESVELLQEYFDIAYSKSSLHRNMVKFNKEMVVQSLIDYASRHLSFDFTLVFYDVTTLYFESQPDNVLKNPGYSKDGKHNQPQILIGLVVDKNGFPIFYDIFKGNAFEGHTMMPIIQAFKERFKVKNLTLVADSAMLSENNLFTLEAEHFNYIVGNRTLATYKDALARRLSRLKRKDNSITSIKQDNRFIIYHYSQKREKKDLYEINKAVDKAMKAMKSTSKQPRTKFLTLHGIKAKLNNKLIQKHTFLAGIKSYKTNVDMKARLVVDRYADLWKIEKAFRMTKHDLKARPIFHRKDDAIRAHILIVFVANAVSKHIELITGKSIRYIVKDLMKIIEVKFKLRDSHKIYSMKLKPH